MEILIIILLTIMAILSLVVIYCGLMLIRNNKVFNLRAKWIESHDWARLDKYTYNYMFRCKDNWYGLKRLKESDYPSPSSVTTVQDLKNKVLFSKE